MNLLNSSLRCDSLMLVVRQSHSEAAYGDINVSANYKIISAQKYYQCLGCLQGVGLTTGETWGLHLPTGRGSSWLPFVSLVPSAVSSLLLAQGSERGLDINLEARLVTHSHAES